MNQELLAILIVDDDVKGGELLKKGLEVMSDIQAECVHSGEDALTKCRKKNYDAILMDLNLPGINGIEAMENIKKERPNCPIIMITGHNEIQSAVQSIKRGAFDYLVKPLDLDHVSSIIKRAYEQTALKRKNEAQALSQKIKNEDQIIHGPNSPIEPLIHMAEKIASSDATTLINGESGTGKELFARKIYHHSVRVNQPFIEVNCGAIPHELLESEFFGHEKGAFTGAMEKREGLFSVADKGTIFLDEIGEMPLPMQVKLLRTLQSGEIRKVGGNHLIHINVRIIAATSKNLQEEVKAGHFREDLFYRLNVINLVLPPLRKRKMDIPFLIDHFIKKLHIGGKKVKGIEPKAMELLTQYDWPGNIRELKNTIERIILLSEKEWICYQDVQQDFRQKNLNPVPSIQKEYPGDLSLANLEAYHIQRVLDECSGNKTQAAKKLGITVQTLYNKLKGFHTET